MDKKNDMKLKRVVKSSPLKKLILSNPISIVSQMMLNPSYKVIQLPNDTFKTSLTVKSGTYFGYGQSIKTSKAAAAKAVLNDILKKFIQRKTQTDNNEQQQLINDANYDVNDISSGHILAYMMDFYLESAGKNNTYVVQKDDLSHSEPVQAVRQKFPEIKLETFIEETIQNRILGCVANVDGIIIREIANSLKEAKRLVCIKILSLKCK